MGLNVGSCTQLKSFSNQEPDTFKPVSIPQLMYMRLTWRINLLGNYDNFIIRLGLNVRNGISLA